MNSDQIRKRLEECLVGKDTLTRIKGLLNFHGEVFKQILDDTKNIKSKIEKDRTGINLIKKVNYQWIHVENILKNEYPNENIPDDIFRQLTISLSVTKDQPLLKELNWLYVKKSDHIIFKTLRNIIYKV